MPATIHQLAAPAPEDPARSADIAALLEFVEDRAYAAGRYDEARRAGTGAVRSSGPPANDREPVAE